MGRMKEIAGMGDLFTYRRSYNGGKPRVYKTTVQERFEAKLIPEPNSGCWLWFGALCNSSGAGYGAFAFNGRRETAQRASWMIFCGPIPDGFEIDHRCRNTYCVNPDHLRPMTQADNLAGRQLHQEFCRKGHPLSGKNILNEGNGIRRCRRCREASRIRYYTRVRKS